MRDRIVKGISVAALLVLAGSGWAYSNSVQSSTLPADCCQQVSECCAAQSACCAAESLAGPAPAACCLSK